MELLIYHYIDYRNLFIDLFNEYEEELEEHRYEADHFDRLLLFKNSTEFDEWEIDECECEFTDKTIIWYFGFDFNDANESNNVSTTADYTIVFDRVLDEFTICDYEQG